MAKKPTKAQRALLTWLVAAEKTALEYRASLPAPRRRQGDVLWTGGDLIPYYSGRAVERELARYAARGETPPEWAYSGYRLGGYANHGWRRAGGTALKRCAAAGYLVDVGLTAHGVPQYTLTDEGREVGNEQA